MLLLLALAVGGILLASQKKPSSGAAGISIAEWAWLAFRPGTTSAMQVLAVKPANVADVRARLAPLWAETIAGAPNMSQGQDFGFWRLLREPPKPGGEEGGRPLMLVDECARLGYSVVFSLNDSIIAATRFPHQAEQMAASPAAGFQSPTPAYPQFAILTLGPAVAPAATPQKLNLSGLAKPRTRTGDDGAHVVGDDGPGFDDMFLQPA